MNTRRLLNDQQLDDMIASARPDAWPGGSPPDTNPRVEAFLKEQSMSATSSKTLKRSTIALIAVGVLGAGGLAAAFTHQIMSRRAVVITDDGTEYQVELLDSPEGASGTFVTDDGTVYGINMLDEGSDQRSVTVDIEGASSGTSTVTIGNDAAGTFTDENGNTFEVDQDAVDSWVEDDASDD